MLSRSPKDNESVPAGRVRMLMIGDVIGNSGRVGLDQRVADLRRAGGRPLIRSSRPSA